MRGPVRRIVFVPRFTGLYGPADLYTVPVNLREFASMELCVWSSSGNGSTPATAQYLLQQSTDLENWHDVGNELAPAGNAEMVAERSLDLEWVRLRMQIDGTDPGATGWAVADCVPRESD